MSKPFCLEPIGIVRNKGMVDDRPGKIKKQISRIEIFETYQIGLLGLEAYEWIVVVFGLDRIEEMHLEETRFDGTKCGIFACRSPYRPNRIGVTTCRLLALEKNAIEVEGLDAADLSPVFDLKCPDTSEQELKQMHRSVLIANPRHDIDYDIRNHLAYELWVKAGQLGASLSSELALGVIAGLDFMEFIRQECKKGINTILHAPSGSPLTDGAMFVTGISPASNRLFLYETDTFIPSLNNMPTNDLDLQDSLCFDCELFTVVYSLRRNLVPNTPVKEWIDRNAECFFKREIERKK